VAPLPFDLVFQEPQRAAERALAEPDVNDHLAMLAKGTLPDGTLLPGGPPAGVVVVPAGFVSDHMEVVHDLDVEAAETAATSACRSPGPRRPP